MSFLDRLQTFVLSGFLATTATSCPPERFFSSDGNEDEPLTCPVRNLPVISQGPDGTGRVMTALAARDIDPEAFHWENLDRFEGLTVVCSQPQIDRYGRFQDLLADRVGRMSPAEIAETLEGLYRQIYVYDESTRTMAVGDGPSHREAKRRLDLWIAAVDHQAFLDEDFSTRLWDEKRVRVVMSLNSPHLDTFDRGALERLFRAEAQGERGLREVLSDRPLEGYVRFFDWLQTYDGQRAKYFEDPFWRSQMEAFAVIESHFGRESFLRLSQSAFPREVVEKLIEERGYGTAYHRFLAMGSEDLIRHYHEVMLGLSPLARPRSRQRMVEDLMIMGIVFDQRGMDPMDELRRRGIKEMVRWGYSPEDATLMDQLQTGMAPYTQDRLDDYRVRHGLLGAYRRLYRDLLTLPLEEVFSPANAGRYARWGTLILNRSLMKTPIFLEDLDRIRYDVVHEVGPSLRLASPGDFERRDRYSPQWYTPYDLGLCGSLTGGPMASAGLTVFNGASADDFICENVELMAFLTPSLHQDHALATAIGVFGVITVKNTDSTLVRGRLQETEWTPSSLTEALTHEASHIDWFRRNFDRDSQRLPMSGLNERRAYITGRGYAEDYAASGLIQPYEAPFLEDRIQFLDELTTVANDTIGIPQSERGADYWEPRWDADPIVGRYAFQPPSVLNGRRQRELLERTFGLPTEQVVSQAWSRLFIRAQSDLRLTPIERREVHEALRQMNTSEESSYFLRSHPFTRVVNQIQGRLGLLPVNVIDMDAVDWATFQFNAGRRSIDGERWSYLVARLNSKR